MLHAILLRICRRSVFAKNAALVLQHNIDVKHGLYNFTMRMNNLSDLVCASLYA